MRSIQSILNRKMNRKGIFGLDAVGNVMLTVLTLVVTAIAVFLALSSLQNAGIFTAGSANANNTNYIIANTTQGATSFFTNVPTIFTVLGVVAIILVISLIIYAVKRFSQGSETASL